MPEAAGIHYFHKTADRAGQPAVVLIHGAGGTHLSWPPQIRRLLRCQVYALDLPAHGKSGGAGKQLIDDYAKSIMEFIQVVMVSPAVIIGHSLGGAIAMTLAIRASEYVSGVVLIGSGARLRVSPLILDLAADPNSFAKAVGLIISKSYSSNVNPTLKKLGEKQLLEIRPAVLYGDLRACDEFNVMDQLDRIQCPTLILCGAEDQMTPLKYSEFLCAHIPAAQMEIIQDAGHMVMIEQHARVASAIARFLDSFKN